MKVLYQYWSPSGKILQTSPYPRPLRNTVKALDQVIAATTGPGNYRMSMEFVRGRQSLRDKILVYPCEGEYCPTPAERGTQAHASLVDLTADYGSLSLGETQWAHMLRS